LIKPKPNEISPYQYRVPAMRFGAGKVKKTDGFLFERRPTGF